MPNILNPYIIIPFHRKRFLRKNQILTPIRRNFAKSLCFTVLKIVHICHVRIPSTSRDQGDQRKFRNFRFVFFSRGDFAFLVTFLVTLGMIFEGMRNYAGVCCIICSHKSREEDDILQRTSVQVWGKCTGARSGKFPLSGPKLSLSNLFRSTPRYILFITPAASSRM